MSRMCPHGTDLDRWDCMLCEPWKDGWPYRCSSCGYHGIVASAVDPGPTLDCPKCHSTGKYLEIRGLFS